MPIHLFSGVRSWSFSENSICDKGGQPVCLCNFTGHEKTVSKAVTGIMHVQPDGRSYALGVIFSYPGIWYQRLFKQLRNRSAIVTATAIQNFGFMFKFIDIKQAHRYFEFNS